MKDIPFVKYTSYGNNFVIVDETQSRVLSEAEKSQFAFHATNTCFGVGCDNLLVLQRCDDAVLEEINQARGYWETTPDSAQAEFVFRMFEPNGDEAFSCGNGLMAVASHLSRCYGVKSAKVLTELPFREPRTVKIGQNRKRDVSWVDMGAPRRVPAELASEAIRKAVDDCVDVIDNIGIRFRSYDLQAYTGQPTLKMVGYLVFTGEPHMVIFPHESFSDPELARPMFSSKFTAPVGTRVRRRVSLGSWLVRRIGVFLNDYFRSHFPFGININFAHVAPEQRCIEYRCFERGINRETLACGTGALAAAVVARHLGMLPKGEVSVLPHLCRWHQRDAEIRIAQEHPERWRLTGSPRLLFDGTYSLRQAWDEYEVSEDVGSDTLELLSLEGQLLMRPALVSQ